MSRSKDKSFAGRLLSDSFVYGLTGYLNVLAGIFLTPIYTRTLSMTDYGVLDIFNTWNGFALVLLPLGLPNALNRWYPDVKDQHEGAKTLFSTILLAVLVVGVVYALVMWGSESFFSRIFLEDTPRTRVYLLSIFIVLVQLFVTMNTKMLRIRYMKWSFLAVSVTGFLVLSALGFYLVYSEGRGVVGFFEAAALSSSLSAFLCVYLNRDLLGLSFSLRELKPLLSYSIHFLSVFVMFKAVALVDRYLISTFLGLEEVGLYSIAARFGSFFNLALNAFAFAWMPLLYALKMTEKAKKRIRETYVLYAYAGALIITLIAVFRVELFAFFAPGYTDAYHITLGLVLFAFISGLSYVLAVGIHLSKNTHSLTVFALISVSVNVFLSLVLVRFFGLAGIVLGSIAATCTWIVLVAKKSQRLFYVQYGHFSLIESLAFFILFSVVFTAFDAWNDFVVNRLGLAVKTVAAPLLMFYAFRRIKAQGGIVRDNGVNG